MELDKNPELDAAGKLDRYLDRLRTESPPFYAKLEGSISIIEEAFRIYKWDEIRVAFNGGKDCTALLHLVHAVVCKKFPEIVSRKLKSVYYRPRLPFEEMELFIELSRERYNLDLISWNGNSKEALQHFSDSHPEVRAVFMGTRASDPDAHQLDAWAKTDPGWPELMRISPLITWTYSEMWKFLRDLSIPYCSLYDQGYTSIGNKDNTGRNPALQYVDSEGIIKYKPAYLLETESLERDGRKANGV